MNKEYFGILVVSGDKSASVHVLELFILTVNSWGIRTDSWRITAECKHRHNRLLVRHNGTIYFDKKQAFRLLDELIIFNFLLRYAYQRRCNVSTRPNQTSLSQFNYICILIWALNSALEAVEMLLETPRKYNVKPWPL